MYPLSRRLWIALWGLDRRDHPRTTSQKEEADPLRIFSDAQRERHARPQERARATFSRHLLPWMLGRWVARFQARYGAGRDIESCGSGRTNTGQSGVFYPAKRPVRSWLLSSGITAVEQVGNAHHGEEKPANGSCGSTRSRKGFR